MSSVSTVERNPRIKGKVVRMLAEGKTLRETAEATGLDDSAIWRWKNRDEAKKRIEDQAAEILALTPRAVDTYKRILAEAENIETAPHLIEYPLVDPITHEAILDAEGKPQTIMVMASEKTIANNIKLISVAKDAAKDILQSGGILASHTESRTVIAILSGDAAEALTPALAQLMGAIVDKPEEQEAIDITPE